MRGALLDHPKVIAMTRVLQQNRDFREWLTPGGSGDFNGKIVSDPASRAVTTALLLRAWSSAREHGKFIEDDLWLEHSWVEDIDHLAGAPGLGLAMEAVGWVAAHPTKKGIILPNFKEFNVPMTEAERAKSYRDRKKNGVTNPSRTHRDENMQNVTTREEERRVLKQEGQAPDGASSSGPVWGESLTLLQTQGHSEKAARAFLGMLCRDYEESAIAAAVLAAAGKADMLPYIRGVLAKGPKRGDGGRRLAV